MSKDKYTAALWMIYETNPYGFRFADIKEEGGELLFQNMQTQGNETQKNKALANARLVAAAPELFEVLKRILTFPYEMRAEERNMWRDKGHILIAKIEAIL